MKEFMQIIETAMTARLPAWYEHAPPVSIDDEDAFPNTAYILEPEEFEYEWRLCEVPASEFSQIVGPDFFTWFQGICPSEPRETEARRVAEVEQWMGSDAHAALRSSPLIVMINPQTHAFELLDGHHRAAVAIHKYGLASLPCVVSVGARATDYPD